jgi:hypothetical protein
MKGEDWVIFTVGPEEGEGPDRAFEVAAQRMFGWRRDGPALRTWLGPDTAGRAGAGLQDADNPQADGEFTLAAIHPDAPGAEQFDAYAELNSLWSFGQTLTLNEAFNSCGLDSPEDTACLRRLAERLLDPAPVASAGLSGLAATHGLARPAGTPLGDLQTLTELAERVLGPVAEAKGHEDLADCLRLSEEEWYPSLLTFGPFRDRSFAEGLFDSSLLAWLKTLAEGSSIRGAAMARWYLSEIEILRSLSARPAPGGSLSSRSGQEAAGAVSVWRDPDLDRLKAAVSAARMHLAALEADLMSLRWQTDASNSALYRLLAPWYRRRDRARLVVEYRRRFLDALFSGGEREAGSKRGDHAHARERMNSDYDAADREAAVRKELDPESGEQIKRVWRKLAGLCHPDRFARDPERHALYARLMTVINGARDSGDLALLQEISENPEAYMQRQGWGTLNLSELGDGDNLRATLAAIEADIRARQDAIRQFRESADFVFSEACRMDPGLIARVAQDKSVALEAEIKELAQEAGQIEAEIRELTGTGSGIDF